MKRESVNLTADRSRGMAALKGGAVAAYADAVRVELADATFLYISGKTGIDRDHRLVGRTMREQTEQTIKNIQAVLEKEGGTLDNVVRVRVYVTQLDSASLRDVHEVRAKYFRQECYPASTLVRVGSLVRDGALIEIDADAVLPRK